MRTRRMLRGAATIIALGAFGGCNELEDIPKNDCGNGIVEEHEDCDSFGAPDQPGTACSPPGGPDECRFDCSSGDLNEGAGGGAGEPARACPTGYACGVHGSCRAPTGRFERLGEPILEDIFSIQIADFDGDKLSDVITVGGQEVRVRYYDENGDVATKATVPTSGGQIALGHLTDDKNADFAFNVGTGFGVMRGQNNKSIAPTQYPIEVDPKGMQISLIGLEGLPDQPGDEVLAFLTDGKMFGLLVDPESALTNPMAPTGLAITNPSAVLMPIATGNVLTGPSGPACDEIVLTHGNGDVNDADPGSIDVVTPCEVDAVSGAYKFNLNTSFKPLKLPADHKVKSSARVVDINDDAVPDVIVGAVAPCATGLCCFLDVAYGTASDALSSTLDPTDVPDMAMSPLLFFEGADDMEVSLGDCANIDNAVGSERPFPLAVGDLNGDGIGDIVDANRVWQGVLACNAGVGAACVNAPPDAVTIVYGLVPQQVGPWTEAAIADFNRDGVPDIIGGSSSTLGLDFYQGAKSASGDIDAPLSAFQISTRGPTSNLTVGNFDGDLAPDLAFSQANAFDPSAGDSLAVLFGKPLEPPSTIIEMGELHTLKQLVAGNFAHYTFSNDSLADLLAVTEQPDTDPKSKSGVKDETLLLPGTTNRQLQSPVRLGRRDDMSLGGKKFILTLDVPGRIVLGQFTADSHADAAVLAHRYDVTLTGDPMNPDVKVDDYFPLWMLQSSGEAEFEGLQKGNMSVEPSKSTEWPSLTDALRKEAFAENNSAMVAVDLTKDGLDEVLIFVPNKKDSSNRLFLATVGGQSWTFEEKAPLSLQSNPAFKWVNNIQTVVADADGDAEKKQDVVVLVEGRETDPDTSVEEDHYHLVILWNQGNTSLDVMTELPKIVNPETGATEEPLAFAVLRATANTSVDIAVTTATGTYLSEVDAATRALSTPVRVEGVPGGTAIAAGDVNGDGLDDLVIGNSGEASVFLGVPQNR